MTAVGDRIELSVVIPVYNGSKTIGRVVHDLLGVALPAGVEIILVNDGSEDESELVCRGLVDQHPGTVRYVHLSNNFGEHNAVLAGLSHARGDFVTMIDDDGQNPPDQIPVLLHEIQASGLDVVYGRYVEKRHARGRNLGSWFNDRVATFMLKKPSDLYLSSFKIMNRFTVDGITRYKGPFPYIDGLIFRVTRRVSQVSVTHSERIEGHSQYTLKKLVKLWLNMFFSFSIAPLRVSLAVGVAVSIISLLLMIAVVVDKLWITKDITLGIPSVLLVISFFSGVQLLLIGLIGEYLGRLFMDYSGAPQFVVRYVHEKEPVDE